MHAVNTREMIFIMIYISFDMILGAYLIGNMTALIVKGSKTERFRDKMTELIKYMNRNKLGRDIRSQIKDHLLLQYESNYTKASILDDIPVAVRAKVTYSLTRLNPCLTTQFAIKFCSNVIGYVFFISLQISQTLYSEMVQKVPLFKGCSDEFLNQIVRSIYQ